MFLGIKIKIYIDIHGRYPKLNIKVLNLHIWDPPTQVWENTPYLKLLAYHKEHFVAKQFFELLIFKNFRTCCLFRLQMKLIHFL